MDRKKYDDMILLKIEKSLDLLIPLGSLSAFFVAMVVLFSNIPSRFVVYDLVLSSILALLVFFRKSLSSKVKIVVISFVLLLLGGLSVFNGGFSGTGIPILILSGILIIGFMPFKVGFIYNICIVLFLSTVPILIHFKWVTFSGNNAYLNNNPAEWIIHIATYFVLNIVIIIMVNSIKSYLIQTITDTENYMDKVYHLAFHDQLTGLPNKIKFFEIMDEKIMDRGFLVLFSVKGLTLINSIYGDQMGDAFLSNLADKMKSYINGNEILARISGTEFAWYFSENDEEQMRKRILTFIELSMDVEKSLDVQSILYFYGGYVKIDSSTVDITQYYQKALIALEHAKRNKNNHLTAYDLEEETLFRRNERIKELISSAIMHNEFYMHYQEKKDITGTKTVGVEALARWNSAELGAISPGVFIPIIEKSHQIIAFGNRIITLVLDDYPKICQKYSSDIRVAINISPHHMLSPTFVEDVTQMIQRRQISSEAIILEITEEALIDDVDKAIRVISLLRKNGFKIALDDFGTGYSSLNYLASLDVDEVKIDRSFISKLTQDSKTYVLIQAIINMQSTYGFTVVAEGVETQQQCDILQSLGCNIIQGFLYSRPSSL